MHLHRELCNRGTLHIIARERVLLPAWREAGYKELAVDALVPHAQFKRCLADLMVAAPARRPEFLAVLDALIEAASLQRDADEEQILPAMRKALDADARRGVLDEIDRLYALSERHDDMTIEAALDADAASAPGVGLLHDAKLVLGSIGAPAQDAGFKTRERR